MKALTINKLKEELKNYTQEELVEISLKLAKFKIENKELLTYILFDSHNEDSFVGMVKEEIDSAFLALGSYNAYTVKKSLSKILRMIKKHVKYSKNKETEATLLFHFCKKIQELKASLRTNQQIFALYQRQLVLAKKAVGSLHEDLQYDYNQLIEELTIE